MTKLTAPRAQQFEKKMAAYAFASAAVLVSPAAAHAGIIHIADVNATVSNGSYQFNLSGPSSADLTLTSGTFSGFDGDTNNGVQVFPTNGAVVSSGSEVAALAFGDLIDPATSTFGAGGKLVGYDTAQSEFNGGAFSFTGGDNYLGFYFNGTSGPQAGWAHITTSADVNGSSFEVLDYAYQSDANTAINAGDIGDAAAPEPSSIALIALGGAGLLALRRRRAANA